MKRYASIDFMRGLAIIMMLCLHMINTIIDKGLIDQMNELPMISILSLLILPFLGGLAGFFLLISAISNMISMYKFIEKGKSPRNLIKRQILTGSLIIIFGMLSEGLIGYHGTLGKLLGHLDNINIESALNQALFYWNNFETIHTIGWCIVLNGIVHGLISRDNGWKNPKKMMKIYIFLAIFVLILTQFVWDLIYYLIPGYPWEIHPITGNELSLGQIGINSPGELIGNIFLTAFAAEVEPIFPYLAVSFIGSIIGIGMACPRDDLPKNFVKKTLITGLIMFIVGLISTIVVLTQTGGFNSMIDHYLKMHQHRNWDPNYPDGNFPKFAWVAQFLLLNGFSIMGTMTVIFLVEFRGKGAKFAQKTKFIRRYGFVALTAYNIQWIYFLTHQLFSFIFGEEDLRANFGWGGTLFIVFFTLLVFQGIFLLWEKVNYVGTIEWMIGTIGMAINPMKRNDQTSNKKWWEKGALDVENAFYNPEWISIYKEEEISIDKWGKILNRMAIISLASIIFIPFNIVILRIMLKNKNQLEKSSFYRKTRKMALIGTLLFALFILFISFVSFTNLGIKL
jgi:hypothetical protein